MSGSDDIVGRRDKLTQGGQNMKTVAVIDDDVAIGDLLAEVLTREGYGVLRALVQRRFISLPRINQTLFCWI